MNKAYKFRIYPTEEQKVMFAKTFGCVRFIYNKMLEDKIEYYEKTKKKLKNTPAQYKKEFEWLKEVDSLALANTQLNLQTAYENFFRSPQMGFPKFKSKHRSRESYTTNNQKDSIRIEDRGIKLPKVGYVKIKQHRDIPIGYKLKSATISKTPTGKYFVSILFEYVEDVLLPELKNIVGLDFSMKELFVSSNGETAEYPHFYHLAQIKLAKEQRKLSKCQRGGLNYRKQRVRVAKVHEKVANQRRDFLHKISRKITNSYDVVCVENLDMKEMAQTFNFGKKVFDNGWGMFTTFLDYKLSNEGKKLVKIDKWFPSSKICSHCGGIKDEMPLSERMYVCECGFTCDRDINAAINIKNEGKLQLA